MISQLKPSTCVLLLLALGPGCGSGGRDGDHVPLEDAGDGAGYVDGASSGGSSGSGGSVGESVPCHATQPLDGGTACAVVPSETGAGINDAPDPSSSSEYHAVGIPDSSGPDTPVFVFLKGTGGIPFAPAGAGFNDATLRILQEGIDHGFIVLMPAYPRLRGSTIHEFCAADLLCYEPFRRELAEGVPRDPNDPASIRAPNDITSRLEALALHLAAIAPSRFSPTLDWSRVRVGGASQGAGHTGFIAKKLRSVERACLLAGLGDNDIPISMTDAGAGNPAAWLTDSTWETTRERFRGLIHENDQFFRKTTAAWLSLGLELDRDWKTLTGATPAERAHGYPVSDAPEAVAAREWACWE